MSNLVLYRKYRPKTFGEVVGQEHVIQTLVNALSSSMISHAYLFSGPRGSGKTSTARLLAKAVNCEQRKEGECEPCNQCSSCSEVNEGRAIDLIEIDAASNTGVDDIRELKEGIRFTPTKSKYKVFIVDECLTGEHLISMADGTVKRISEVKNGEKIASIDIHTGNINEKSVTNWFKRTTNKILEIKTPQTLLKVTPSHRIWILRDSEFLLKEAKDLRIDDFLLSPVYLPHIQKNNLTSGQLSLLALIQCDGHVSKDSITVQIEINKDKDYFQEIVERGLEAWRIQEKPVIKKTARGTRLIRVYSKTLKDNLINLGCPAGKKGQKIDIPNIVFQAPLESIKAYIDTCFCCEGDISPFGIPGNINYRLNFTSGSETFVKKLQLLLKKFGIGSNILEIKKRNKRHSTMYRLSLSGYNLRLFAFKIGLALKRKDNLFRKFLQKKERQDTMPIEKLILDIRRRKEIKHSELASYRIYPALGQHLTRRSITDFIKIGDLPELNKYLQFRYEKIKKIKIKDKTTEVYDFTVRDTHTFIANGICSSNCHQLSKGAANALLKTLEEPPAHAIFVLATTEIHKMIPTIISRCQRFDFRKLTLLEIVARLEMIVQKEGVNIEKPALELMALNSGGAVRDAEGFLDQALTFSGASNETIKAEHIKDLLGMVDTNLVSQLFDFLCQKNSGGAIKFLNNTLEKGKDVQELTKALIHYLRQGLILKIDNSLQNPIITGLTQEEQQKLQSQTSALEEADLRRILKLFLEAENRMKYSSIPQLPLELAIIESASEAQAERSAEMKA